MGRKIHECTCGAFDDACLTKAAIGEPIFVLRGQDSTAAQRVEDWVENIDRQSTSPLSAATETKLTEAMECAASMRRWRPQKFPD